MNPKAYLFAVAAASLLTFSSTAAALNKERAKVNFKEIPNREALKTWPKPRTHASTPAQKAENVVKALTSKRSTSKFLKADESAETQRFRSVLLYSDLWDDDDYQYGVYDFTTPGTISFAAKYINTSSPQNGGGFFANDKYYFTSYVADDWGYDYDVTTYVVNTNTWKVTEEYSQSLTSMATDMDYDPVTGLAFGCFYSSSGRAWGYMDPTDECYVTHIAELDGDLVAVAANSQGEFYAITDNGVLAKVDKYTGELTAIGATGITPAYMQSAAFSEDGTLYWAAGFSDGSSGLFTVDTTTGRVALVGDFPNDEEVVALQALPAEVSADAPAKAESLDTVFTDDSLSGTLVFKVPATTYGGSTFKGTVDYTIYIDSKEYSTGSSTTGATVTANVAVTSAGFHTFGVRLKNTAGESELSTLVKWVGIDRPTAVTNLTLTKTGSFEATLNWDAPTGTVNGGYFNASRLSYTITRLTDNAVVATNLKATTFVDTLTLDSQAYVTYKVTAYADEVAGVSATSNGAVFGSAYNTPVEFNLDTEDEYNLFTVIDNNETVNLDSGMWEYSPSAGCAGYVSGTKDGDDWFITPDINLKSDRYYTFAYNVCCYSDYWPDLYEVFMGKGATIEAMTTRILDQTDIYWDDYRYVTLTIKVDEDGVYNFGFHALSEAGGAYFLIDDISITDSYALKAPNKVTNLTATADENGALKATIAFQAPSICADESELTSITTINVVKNNAVLKAFDAPQPGATLSFVDEDIDEAGNVTYTVTAVNAAGTGIASTIGVWVGPDTPSKPTDITVTVNAENHPVITWQAPEGRGSHNGYCDNSTASYIVYRMNDSTILANGITDLSYTDTAVNIPTIGSQSIYEYAVFAMTDAGLGNYDTAFTVGGKKYDLPYTDSFTNGASEHLWLSSSTDDKGLILITPATAGTESTIFTGKIDMTTAKNPTLSFYLHVMSFETNGFDEGNPEDDTLELLVGTTDCKLKTFKTIRPSEVKKGGYQLQNFDLSEFAGTDFIIFGFKANSVSGLTPMAIDNITLRNNYNKNLAVTAVDAPESANVTDDITITATVQNDGAEAVSAYAVTLYCGEKALETINVTDELASKKEASFEFTATVEGSWADKQLLQVAVAFNGDENDKDDAVEFEVEVKRPEMPTVDNLQATVDADGTATFTWSAPDIDRNFATTDNFEDYTHGATRNYGNWSTIDDDGEYGFGYFYSGDDYVNLPHPFNAQSFMVIDDRELELEIENHPLWQAHSGHKYLISLYNSQGNDDWLISPELSGEEQVISFYARTPQADSGDFMRVYYAVDGKKDTDFLPLTIQKVVLSTEWTKYEYTLPEGSIYFAIRNTLNSDSNCAIMIDDATFIAASSDSTIALDIEGYNLYCNGEQVNDDVITDTTFTVTDVANGIYTVTVIYNVGESAASNEASIALTGIENVLIDAVNNNEIYDLQGRRVARPSKGNIYIMNGKKFRF
jgi:hypothetical protein